MSFRQWDILSPENPWIGLANYVELLSDQVFIRSLWNTLYFVGLSLPLQVGVGFALALVLNKAFRGRALYRAFFFFPYLISVTVVAIIWSWVMNTGTGMLNYYLEKVGFLAVPWLGSRKWAMPSIIITNLWWKVGFSMVVFLAALQEIPQRLYEAARIDGANKLQELWFITIPSVKPVLLFVVVIILTESFRVFGLVYIMTEGGPADSTRVLVQEIYDTGFKYFRMGSASAMAYAMGAILTVLTFSQFKLLGETRK